MNVSTGKSQLYTELAFDTSVLGTSTSLMQSISKYDNMAYQAADESENEPLQGITIPCDAAVTPQVAVVREDQDQCCNRSCIAKFRLCLLIIKLILLYVLYQYIRNSRT